MAFEIPPPPLGIFNDLPWGGYGYFLVLFKLPYIGPFSIKAQHRIKKLVRTFCSDLDIKLVFTRLKLRVGLGSRILSLRVYDRELFISFHVQVVVPVMLVKPTDTSPLTFANISPPTKIPTSLST